MKGRGRALRSFPRFRVGGLALLLGGVLVAAVAPATAAAAAVAVEIAGLEGPLLQNARQFLSIRDVEDEGEVAASEVRRLHRLAPEQIREALRPFGYYRPRISSELKASDGGFRATYRVDPGEPARLRRLTIRAVGEGAEFPAVRRALETADLEPGQRLVHQRYERAKQAIFDAAYEHGFLDAAWQSSRMLVQPDRLHADIELVLDTGPRYYFGEVSIRQSVLQPRLMERFVEIAPGEPYDVARLLDLQRTLSETDYFGRVEVNAEPDRAGPDQRVPVEVVTRPAAPRRYTVSMGYGTDTGPRLGLGVLVRHVNALGHRFRANVQISEVEQAVGTRYEIPIRNVATDSLSFFASARQEEIGDADTDRFEIGASHVVSWLGFRRQLYVRAQREQFDFAGEPQRETDVVFPGVTLSRERANDLQYPTRGYSVRADLRAGVKSLLSDVSFTRYTMTAHWVRGIAADTRLLLRAEAGMLWTSEFQRLPPSQRFFAGGDRSVRGYGYRSLGEENAAGDVLGGERLIAASLELERFFHGNYGGAVFVDVGDAFDGSPELKTGAGAGFRWRSPIGVVSVDLAHPFDHPDAVRLHITIGRRL
ncbi:MAG: autotransporter assembly complex protein TamA [Pseudomonadota bacterium]